MALRLVTFSDKPLDGSNLLAATAHLYGYQLEVLGIGVHWKRNAIKLRILNDFLKNENLLENELILIVDAFDVILNASMDSIISRYHSLRSDIVFSSEANYYFRESNLSMSYWINYPRHTDTMYHFLNSGTFMGTVSAIRWMLDEISRLYKVNYDDESQLIQIRSDQYLYSRFYVDDYMGKSDKKYQLILDSNQKLFGCSGGRMAVINWPSISWIQDYLFFKYERRMLKTFGLKKGAELCRDLEYDTKKGTYMNKISDSRPQIIHLPGTYSRFRTILGKIKRNILFTPWTLLIGFTGLISFVAYIRSIVNYHYIAKLNEGKIQMKDIFPNIIGSSINHGLIVKRKKPFPKDNPFTI